MRSHLPEGAELTRRFVEPTEKRFLLSAGYVRLEDLWNVEFARALADEARGRFPFAEIPDKGPRVPLAETRKPRPQTTIATGELLSYLHVSSVGLARALSGRLLVPSFSAYGYYPVDDAALLHLDTYQCDFTLLTTALGEVGPLHLHPELCGMTMEELGALESDPAWDHASGLQVGYPSRGLMAFNGAFIPHNRPGNPVPGLSAVATLCYRSRY